MALVSQGPSSCLLASSWQEGVTKIFIYFRPMGRHILFIYFFAIKVGKDYISYSDDLEVYSMFQDSLHGNMCAALPQRKNTDTLH